MIEGNCTTNLDEYKSATWPTSFVAVPRVGEFVRAQCGKQLKVVRVVHYDGTVPLSWPGETMPCKPKISVELNR